MTAWGLYPLWGGSLDTFRRNSPGLRICPTATDMPCFVYGSDIRIAIPCLYIPEMTYTTCRSADLPEDYNTTWISSGLCKSCLSRLSPFLFRNVSNYQRKAQSGGKYSTNLFSALIVFSGITYTPVRVCTWLHVTRVICFSSRSLFARVRACVNDSSSN